MPKGGWGKAVDPPALDWLAEMYCSNPRPIHQSLPVYRLDTDHGSVLYTPGHIAVVPRGAAEHITAVLASNQKTSTGEADPLVNDLLDAAHRNEAEWRERVNAPFLPESLTLYLNNDCNLRCQYCWTNEAAPGKEHRRLLPLETVRQAAALVAQGCAQKSRALSVVVHGGGEPTLHWQRLQEVVAVTRDTAAVNGLQWWGYIATNGVVDNDQARWLAEAFDQVCLSCDGPPSIQDRMRPSPLGSSSSRLEQTASIINDADCRLSVRATITPQTMTRQHEIVQYLQSVLHAEEIRFEPVYRVGGEARFAVEDAESFVEKFLGAQRLARRLGIRLSYSGVRMDSLHGSYCNVLRDALHLLPDGSLSSCFFALAEGGMTCGTIHAQAERIARHKRQAACIQAFCRSCVNKYHCARECPEVCSLSAAPDSPGYHGFRCRVNQLLTTRILQQAARVHAHSQNHGPASTTKTPQYSRSNRSVTGRYPAHPGKKRLSPEEGVIHSYLDLLPVDLDRGPLLDNWQQVKTIINEQNRILPQPLWAKTAFTDDSNAAWQEIGTRLQSLQEGGRIAVYGHIPFCRGRCLFCDCHSIPLRAGHPNEDTFVARFLQEAGLWAEHYALRGAPVSTVHLGGGTPTCLRRDNLALLVQGIQSAFACTEKTEWALESTVERLSIDRLDFLKSIGFSRLHLGVQTLEPELRRRIGRKTGTWEVLRAAEQTLQAGITLSVDLVFGLPGQTIKGFIADIRELIQRGVHGFSLYQLQESPRNRVFVNRYAGKGRDTLAEYIMFQGAEQVLQRYGFEKNHFVHYARPQDANLYSTHRYRGEDLVALGPTGDGVIRGYHYRHLGIEEYLMPAASSEDCPWLEGGLQAPDLEMEAGQLRNGLVAGRADMIHFSRLGLENLYQRWLRQGMIAATGRSDNHRLTANGSWFISRLLAELDACLSGNQAGN